MAPAGGMYGTGTGGFGMVRPAAPPGGVANGGPPSGMPPPPSYGKLEQQLENILHLLIVFHYFH